MDWNFLWSQSSRIFCIWPLSRLKGPCSEPEGGSLHSPSYIMYLSRDIQSVLLQLRENNYRAALQEIGFGEQEGMLPSSRLTDVLHLWETELQKGGYSFLNRAGLHPHTWDSNNASHRRHVGVSQVPQTSLWDSPWRTLPGSFTYKQAIWLLKRQREG